LSDVAAAVHVAARAYGSLELALSLTPRRLSAVLQLESDTRARELSESFSVARVAAHGEQKDCQKFLKDLQHDS
jgi:hypothetical protein